MLAAAPAGAEASPAWGAPAEVLQAKDSSRLPWPVETVRGASGAVGVFVFEPDAGLTLRISKDGRAPWKVLLLPNGPAGEPLVSGDRVEVLVADRDAKTLALATFDLAAGKELSRARLPGIFKEAPAFSRLAARGTQRYALAATPEGDVWFWQTDVSGASWGAPSAFGRTSARADACCPPLFACEDGPHVVFAGEGGKLYHRVAAPDGTSWKDLESVPNPKLEHGIPGLVAGGQEGRHFHVVAFTDKFRFLYAASEDAGAHWTPWTVLASPLRTELSIFDVGATFRFKVNGRTLAFTWTGRGENDKDPFECHFLVSRTRGGKWEGFNPAANVKGSTGLAAPFIADDGAITAAFAAAPGVLTGTRYVLVRSTAFAGDEPKAEWWAK